MDYTELGGAIADLNSADLGGQAKFISGPPQHSLTFLSYFGSSFIEKVNPMMAQPSKQIVRNCTLQTVRIKKSGPNPSPVIECKSRMR